MDAKALTKDKSTPENREYWEFVEKTAAEVHTWPAWKTGRTPMDTTPLFNPAAFREGQDAREAGSTPANPYDYRYPVARDSWQRGWDAKETTADSKTVVTHEAELLATARATADEAARAPVEPCLAGNATRTRGRSRCGMPTT